MPILQPEVASLLIEEIPPSAAPMDLLLFNVFNTGRLIDAGILFVDGRPTLVALGNSAEFNCTVRSTRP